MMFPPLFPNSATVHVPEWMILRGGRSRLVPVAVRYGIMRHPVLGLTLIDTGYGPQVTRDANRSFALRAYAAALRIGLREDEAPATVLARLGFAPAEVETILLSHYHADHVARIGEFPQARILAPRRALENLLARSRPGQLHHGFFRELLPDDFCARIQPFETCSRVSHPLFGTCLDLAGDGSLLAVDLPGHALGHHGFLFPHLETPLLHAVDAQWHWHAIRDGRCPGLPASAVYSDRHAAMATVGKVRAFAERGGTVVLSHDPLEPVAKVYP